MFHLLIIISRELQGFGAWWFAELRSLLPPFLTSNWLKHRHCLVLTVHGAEVTLSKRAGGHEQRLGAATLKASAQVEALRAMLRRAQPRNCRVVLRLDSREGLRRMLDLPLAARDDLSELLRLEMDRLSPFTADQVQFAYKVIASDPVNRRIRVELQLAPKRVIDQALAVAARFEVVPESVELAADGADPQAVVNLLPKQPTGTPPSLLDRASVAASALVVAAAMGVTLHQERSAAKDLERQAAAAMGPAEESLALIERLDEIRSQTHLLTERKSKETRAVEVLDELTRLVPDEAYVVQLTLREEEVQLQGFAQDATRLIRLLDRSTLFHAPHFLSPITQDSGEGAERFHIGVTLAEAD
jgi:general secretion pathway protein L